MLFIGLAYPKPYKAYFIINSVEIYLLYDWGNFEFDV